MTTRRQFLQASSALAMTSLAGSAHANRVSALEKTTLGIIGVGKMGRGHLQAMLGKRDVEVVAVCDVVKERLDDAVSRVEKSYAERKKSGDFNGVKSIVDFRELLALPGLDAVLIATPDHWHTIGCILAARAKKHIYCEKPLTHNIAEGRMLVNEVSKANVVFQTGSQQRSEFGGHFRKAVEYVWNGRIGTIKRIRIGLADRQKLAICRPKKYQPEPTGIFGSAPHRCAASIRSYARKVCTITSRLGVRTRNTRAVAWLTWVPITSTSHSGRSTWIPQDRPNSSRPKIPQRDVVCVTSTPMASR